MSHRKHRKVEQDLSLSSKEIDKPVHRHKRPPLIPRHKTAKTLKKNKKLLKKVLDKTIFFFSIFFRYKGATAANGHKTNLPFISSHHLIFRFA